MTNDNIKDMLFELRDEGYREFHAKLIPNVDRERIIGVRTPELRRLAKRLAGTEQAREFIGSLPHEYYEQNNLHGFLIEAEPDYKKAVELLDRFLPYVDNWATCDCISPAAFKKRPAELLPQIKKWIGSGRTYTIRFGIGMLMKFYLDGEFRPEYVEYAARIRSDEYYVNMMLAWYFATALAKQYAAAMPMIEQRRLAPWVHNKAIQKACESLRITAEQKRYLRSLKIK